MHGSYSVQSDQPLILMGYFWLLFKHCLSSPAVADRQVGKVHNIKTLSKHKYELCHFRD